MTHVCFVFGCFGVHEYDGQRVVWTCLFVYIRLNVNPSYRDTLPTLCNTYNTLLYISWALLFYCTDYQSDRLLKLHRCSSPKRECTWAFVHLIMNTIYHNIIYCIQTPRLSSSCFVLLHSQGMIFIDFPLFPDLNEHRVGWLLACCSAPAQTQQIWEIPSCWGLRNLRMEPLRSQKQRKHRRSSLT